MKVGLDEYIDTIRQLWRKEGEGAGIEIRCGVFDTEARALIGMAYQSGSFAGEYVWGSFTGPLFGDASWISAYPAESSASIIYVKGNVGIHVSSNKNFPLIESVAAKIIEKIERNLSTDIRAAEDRAKQKQINEIKHQLITNAVGSVDPIKNYTLLPQYDSKWVVDDSTIVMGKRTEWKNESGTTIGVDVCEFESEQVAAQAAKMRARETWGYTFEMTNLAAADSLINRAKNWGISHKVLSLVSSNQKYAFCFYMIDPVQLDTSLYSAVVKSVAEKVLLITFVHDYEDHTAESPQVFTISQNTPNPFNPATVISFRLASALSVRLTIYDALGREIAILAEGFMQAGNHEVRWNGRDSNGNPVSSGVYLYRLVACGKAETRKMTLVR
jgi:hypothetical protein